MRSAKKEDILLLNFHIKIEKISIYHSNFENMDIN